MFRKKPKKFQSDVTDEAVFLYSQIFHNSIPVMIINTFERQKTEPVRQQWADHNKDSTTMPADRRK